MIIEIKTPMEVIRDAKFKKANRQATIEELKRARRVRGLLRVKLAETCGRNERLKRDLDVADAYVLGLEAALGYK